MHNDENWMSKETRPDILKYLAVRNPLLGLIVEKIHCIESGEESVKLPSVTSPIERKLMSLEANRLATLYDHNVMLVSLKDVVDSERLWGWLDTSVQQEDWLACLEMLTLIPEKQFKSDSRFLQFQDWLLEQLSPTKGKSQCQNSAMINNIQLNPSRASHLDRDALCARLHLLL